jgi:hypothetical protein
MCSECMDLSRLLLCARVLEKLLERNSFMIKDYLLLVSLGQQKSDSMLLVKLRAVLASRFLNLGATMLQS